MNNVVFWSVTSCGSGKNRCFGGAYKLNHRGEDDLLARNRISSQSALIAS
jgi:hypothetical protein